VTRWLAGTLDTRRGGVAERLQHALAGSSSTVFDNGPLHVAYTGPRATESAPLCLLDGYLDNARELAGALRVAADAPSEVILAAGWRRWGKALIARMRGDFGLLLWDHHRDEGLLARDQLGARCIYLHDAMGALYFASETRQLLAMLPRRPSPDSLSVAHWLTMSGRPGPSTLYEGIRRLNPGSMLVLAGDRAREERYWSPRFVEPSAATPDALAQEVRSELQRAVRRRTSEHGLTGVMMSGGLDSASVAAFAAGDRSGRIRACSAVFPEHPAVDEAPLIDAVRARLDLHGVVVEVRAGGLLASALEAIDEWKLPLRSWGDFWALPLLRAAATSGVQMMLGGDGGDEVFGVRAYLLADRLREGHPYRAFALAHELPGAGDHPPRRQLARMLGTVALAGALPYRAHQLLQQSVSAREVPSWLRPRARRGLLDSQDRVAWKRFDGPQWWASSAHALTRGIEEVGVFEHHRQRASSAGLQARHPMLDLDLVDLALRQSPSASFDRHRNRPVLRRAVSGMLPESVRQRPGKALFDSVIVDTLAGGDGAIIRRLLSDPQAALGDYVDQHRLQQTLFGEDALRRTDPFRWMCQVWRLTTAECWLKAQAGGIQGLLPEAATPSPARVVLRAA